MSVGTFRKLNEDMYFKSPVYFYNRQIRLVLYQFIHKRVTAFRKIGK